MSIRQLYTRLARILDEHQQLGIAKMIDYDKFYLYSLITHSTSIEGSAKGGHWEIGE